jgi:hypothetical protein
MAWCWEVGRLWRKRFKRNESGLVRGERRELVAYRFQEVDFIHFGD